VYSSLETDRTVDLQALFSYILLVNETGKEK